MTLPLGLAEGLGLLWLVNSEVGMSFLRLGPHGWTWVGVWLG